VKTRIHIIRDDLSGAATQDLLRLHLQGMQGSSPPGTSFALDLTGLQLLEHINRAAQGRAGGT
jgi:hypothetical protein